MAGLIQKLINIQSSLNAPKNQYNSFGKYHYRSCEDIMAALKPLLKQEGV
ncbi:ERF family protein, partial [Salmonella enterica subsp. diarizonae serovar 16:z10:e,n,x,z15]|nr:ERF family protein [Salmonella enterica subsp. diarizonae serovar 16:z10:e,n,x,z15]MCH5496349.1 ERF family protein [Salmonella enterica subsp. diarizonae serovar 16:z10:e,n,x,z15]MCH5507119.1 ERF family protein [Salmonella enterica subsp. diarizonae serovar 16:z10:e,n,x,z15]